MTTFYIKKGDRLPSLEVQLLDSTQLPIDVSNAVVTFRMRAKGGTSLKASGACTQPNGGTDGVVRFAWGASDTDTAGTYNAEFSCNFSSSLQTVPSSGYVTIVVEDILT